MNEPDSQVQAQSGGSQLWMWLVLALVAGAGFLYVLFTVMRPPEAEVAPQIGRRVPFLKLEPLTGNSRSVTLEDLQGRVSVVNYWGTWCPPCVQEFPHIVMLGEKFGKHEDFRLYPVSCGHGNEVIDELRDETQNFLRSAKVSLPTYIDPNGESRKAMVVGLDLQGFGYPTTLVFDQQGVVRGFCMGFDRRELARMERTIEELLAKPKAESAEPKKALGPGAG